MGDNGGVSVKREGHVLVIGLNRPDKKNALTLKMFTELAQAFTDLQNDHELRCGLLWAHGDDFCSGLDLPQWVGVFTDGKFPLEDHQMDPFKLREPYLQKPVVTAIQGLCLTAGIELMLATDIRVAAKNTNFAQIEVGRGIYPVGGATIRYIQNAGWGNAMRYLLTGDKFSAETAYRIGMIQEVAEDGKEFEAGLALATRIADQAPLGVYASLVSAGIAIREGERKAIERLIPDLQPLMGSEDVQEGMMSFMERRKAEFKGK
jgi:enoyl-CoA hydratase/carnithine racemase